MRNMNPRQVSIRGVVYDQLKSVARAKGVSISKLVEAAVADVPRVARPARSVDHAPG